VTLIPAVKNPVHTTEELAEKSPEKLPENQRRKI